ncbi:hypothetical protein [Lentzea albidocapillata]|uniref:Uncharacterized protein n=1 Tax=Lentzea albidocapillata TaxID=40571 RepID=A0A1W2C012_9PSEU|nr:hypothetical protein [Lentzea albidocapillata]SMC78416.1 hypothetical protein SAMN05660733_01677 [Lentzea albidocapillata]
MSADLDGGAAPASLDDLIVAEPLEAADNGGAAPDAAQDTEAAVAEETSYAAEDAGPAPEAE